MTNKNPFLSPEHFNPKLADKVGAAYRQNLEAGRVPGNIFADGIAAEGLSGVINRRTAEARGSGSAGLIHLEHINHPETRRDFEHCFAIADELFSRIHETPPTPEECVDADVNFVTLGAAYERMKLEGLEPEIVLAPNLSIGSWKRLYKDLQDNQTTTNTILSGGGLVINIEVDTHWDSLATSPNDTPIITTSDESLAWSLRLIAGTDRPTITSTRHDHNQSNHPTISEYLSLQAARLQADQIPPIDNEDTATWLSGTRTSEFGLWAPTGSSQWVGAPVIIRWELIDETVFRVGSRVVPRIR